MHYQTFFEQLKISALIPIMILIATNDLFFRVKIEEVVENLKGIRGPMPIFTDKGTVLSLPDAIGRILEDHAKNSNHLEEIISRPENQEVLPFEDKEKQIADFGFMPGCPECGFPLQMAEGCISCKNCGFSRCS